MRRTILTFLAALNFSAPVLAEESASHSANGAVNRQDRRDVLRRLPAIPLAQASEIALKRVPGILLHAEIETNDGIRTWQVDVRDDAGRKVRIWLNANTGAFLRMVDR